MTKIVQPNSKLRIQNPKFYPLCFSVSSVVKKYPINPVNTVKKSDIYPLPSDVLKNLQTNPIARRHKFLTSY